MQTHYEIVRERLAYKSDPYFLSEVFDISDFSKTQINLLPNNTGAGKTTLALNLIKSIPNCKALYLIDTTNGKESILQSGEMVEYTEQWRKFVDETLVPYSEYEKDEDRYKLTNAKQQIEIIFGTFENRPVIMTYQQYGHILQKYSNFLEFLDIIILDEVHNLAKYYEMEKGRLRAQARKSNPYATNEQLSMHLKIVSPLYLAVESLSKISSLDLYAIAMTATPNKFFQIMDFLQLETNQVETDIRLVAYQTFETEYYSNILQTILKIPLNQKAIIFTPNITHMQTLVRFINDKMSHRGIAIWSIHNTDHGMNKEQLEVREYLKQYHKLPDDIDILIINKSYETGINIVDDSIKQMIIHSTEIDTQTQVRGRLRLDLPKLLLLEPSTPTNDLIIPEEYIRNKLYSEDKEALVEFLNIRKNGKLVKWRGIKNILEKQNWQIQDGRDRKGYFSIIKYKITVN